MTTPFNNLTAALPLATLIACSIPAAGATETSQMERSGLKQDPSVLRICAAANEAPYSTSNGTGFENRIAEVIAQTMNRKAEFVWSERPAIYLVRDQLDPKNCDVVIGVDSGDRRVLTTKPYYRAPYVFVERTEKGDQFLEQLGDTILQGDGAVQPRPVLQAVS